MELFDLLQEIFMSPAVALPLAVFVLVTMFRKLCSIWWPSAEKSRIYNSLLHLLPEMFGIGLAFAARGVGFLSNEVSWKYLIIVGLVAGFISDKIWLFVREWMKKKLGLDMDSIDKAIEVKLRQTNPEIPIVKKDTPTDPNKPE